MGGVVGDEGKQCCRDVGSKMPTIGRQNRQRAAAAAGEVPRMIRCRFRGAAERPKVKTVERSKEPQQQKRRRNLKNLEITEPSSMGWMVSVVRR